MRGKCNSIITALSDTENIHTVFFDDTLRFMCSLGSGFYLLGNGSECGGSVHLMIHSFKPEALQEPPADSETAVKLRFYRRRKKLKQSYMAEQLGIDRSSYIKWEHRRRQSYPMDKLKKAAEILGVDVTALLDDYECFLYRGQGPYLRQLRKKHGLTQKELSLLMGVSKRTIEQWEHERVNMSRRCRERLMELEKRLNKE